MEIEKINDIGFQIGVTGSILRRFFIQSLKKNGIDLTPEQFAILHTLFNNNGITIQELKTAVMRDMASVSRTSDLLQKENFIIKEIEKTDARIRKIFLTDKGREVLKAALDISKKFNKEIVNGLSEDAINKLSELLKIVQSNFNFSN